MAMILEFRARPLHHSRDGGMDGSGSGNGNTARQETDTSDASSNAGEHGQGGEIVLFTGVRYSRWDEASERRGDGFAPDPAGG